MHEHDRDRLDAVGLGGLQRAARAGEVERASISATRSNSMSGLMMCLAKIFGRAW
jgi:hypothetical protein